MDCNKIKEFFKNIWEWLVVIVLFISGYFIWSHFFKKTVAEKKILNDIKQNNEEIKELEKLVDQHKEKEKELEKKEKEITEKIDNKEKEIAEKEKEFEEKKKKVEEESNDTSSNIDYLNKKY